MRNFADRLTERIDALKNPTVMGLDPLIEYVPDPIRIRFEKEISDPHLATAMAIYEFNRQMIDSVCDIIPAVKPQFAYYEKYGVPGIEALIKTIQYAKSKGMLVIADAKRNDIGSTASAYADSILGETELVDHSRVRIFDADAITVNPYLGTDGIKPFIDVAKAEGKGLFILVRTSNPSAGDFQDLILADGKPLYKNVAERVSEWGSELLGDSEYSSVGAVVGATWPEQAKELRGTMKKTLILVPGYGTQGGSADSAALNFNTDGKGAIVNASRSLMCAYKKMTDLPQERFTEALVNEAIRMREELLQAIEKRVG
jgi:orotidine-5'-phosphate decarboxylase